MADPIKFLSTLTRLADNSGMSNQTVSINRPLVGIIALVLLLAAGLLTGFGSEGVQGLWAGACLKVGLVMGAFWLALPSITRQAEFGQASWYALLTTIGLALAVAKTRVPLSVVIPALIAAVLFLRILGPRRSASGSARPKRDF